MIPVYNSKYLAIFPLAARILLCDSPTIYPPFGRNAVVAFVDLVKISLEVVLTITQTVTLSVCCMISADGPVPYRTLKRNEGK